MAEGARPRARPAHRARHPARRGRRRRADPRQHGTAAARLGRGAARPRRWTSTRCRCPAIPGRSAWATRIASSWCRTPRRWISRPRPADRARPALSRAHQRRGRRGHRPRDDPDAGLGARRRDHAGLRLRRLRRGGGHGAARADRRGGSRCGSTAAISSIDWRDDGVWMTGPTTLVFEGRLSEEFLGSAGVTAPVFATLGCRLNAYETEAMKGLAAAAGVTDAVVVNSCAVTAEAVRQARQQIRRLRRDNPGARLIVTGCAAQTEPAALRRDARGRSRARQRREAPARGLGPAARPAGGAGRGRRHHGRDAAGGAADRRARHPGARLRAGSDRLRPPLHLLHHPLRPRQLAQRAGGDGGRADRPAGRPRLQRGGADRGRPDQLGRRHRGRAAARRPGRPRCFAACRTCRGCGSPRSTRSRRTRG